MNYFFAENIGQETSFKLDEKESHHLIHVLRLHAGEKIMLVDGKGNLLQAEIQEAAKKTAIVKILNKEVQARNRNYNLHIAIAPVKSSDRFDLFLEKATEIGIDEITPIISQNSERRKFNPEKFNQTLIAAIKQSGNAWLPKLNEPVEFKKWIKDQSDTPVQKFICHCRPGEKQMLSKSYSLLNNVIILIGPEGDFTEEEITLANQFQFVSATLGENRLRTETAGILSCAIVQIINQLNS
jgi:16S rRNA (uracil1498-N3)-methyltransferase